MNKNTFRNLSYGVYIVSTMDGERPTGCVANSSMQITSEPATIAVSINHDNYTNQCIQKSGKFSLSILGEKVDPTIIGTFGFQSGKDVNKFDTVEYLMKEETPVVAEACSYLVCEVVDKLETSTHTIFLGKVVDAEILKEEEPMTYAYYHKVVKGKSPKNAPTYIPEEDEKMKETVEKDKKQYVCSVCGFTYEGNIPFEELPDSYVCPICKQPKSVFIER